MHVYFKQVVAQTTRGNISSGDNIASADARAGAFPRGFSGDRLTTDIGPMVNGTATYSATLASSGGPIRKFRTVVTGITQLGSRTFRDLNGDGFLYGTGGDFGTINYTTRAVSVTFGTAPDATVAGNAVSVVWQTDFEAQEEIP